MDLLKLGLWSLLVKNGFCCHVYIVTASVEYFRWADQHLSVWSQLSPFVSACSLLYTLPPRLALYQVVVPQIVVCFLY